MKTKPNTKPNSDTSITPKPSNRLHHQLNHQITHKLNLSELFLYNEIRFNPATTIIIIANKYNIDYHRLSPILKRLVKQDIVIIKVNLEDKRNKELYLR